MTWSVYFGVDRYALQAFKGMHDRVRDSKCPSISWPRNREGYLAFCDEIGPHPVGMKVPSVGRKDHKCGYMAGNIQWEEHKYNSVKRRGTKFEGQTSAVVELKPPDLPRGSVELSKLLSEASKRRWSKPGQREAMSKRMKGNRHAAR